jgi:hypothetical protein
MGERKQVGFPYPIKGKNENFAYRQQPEGTTPDALNVRAYDPIANRQRGGQRNGLSKYIASAVNGSNAVQAISQLTTAFDPNQVVAGTLLTQELFPYTAGWMGAAAGGSANWAVFQTSASTSVDLDSRSWYTGTRPITVVNTGTKTFTVAVPTGLGGQLVLTIPNGSTITVSGSTGNNGSYTVSSTSVPTTTTVAIVVVEAVPDGTADGNIILPFSPQIATISGNSTAGVNLTTAVSGCAISQPAGSPQNLGTTFVLRGTFRLSVTSATAGNNPGVGFLFRVPTSIPDGWGSSGTPYGTACIKFGQSTGTFQALLRCGAATNTALDLSRAGGEIANFGGATAWQAAEHLLELRGSGNNFYLYLDGVLVCTHASSENSGNPRWGFGMTRPVANPTANYMRNLQVYTAVLPQSLRSTSLVTVSGGAVYAGSSAGLLALNGGSAVLNTSGIVRMQQAYARMYFVDGVAAHYKVYNPIAGSVALWTPTTGSLPAGQADLTTYPITAATITPNGTFVVTGNLTGIIATGDLIVVSGGTESPSNNGYYRVTGTSYGASSTLTVSPLPLSTTISGTPVLGKAQRGATMIALYRGRIVLSGLSSDPQNWFMSKVGDPLDWNYTPTTINQTMAVAGNNSQAGLMGDVITCLVPYNDDLMFMGGDHTLWVMRGDPAAGGLIDNISYQTGIVGPDAWCRSPDGDFFFFGAGTLWVIASGSTTPQPLSRGVLDKTFGAIDYATYQVRLLWNDLDKGVHLFFTPSNQPASAPLHYFWDKRAGGFWPDQYPAAHGPTAVWGYDADLPTDRAFLIGGFDSYIRQIPATLQKSDDGTPIHSYVRYAPQVVGGDTANSRLSDLVPIMSSTSDPVSLRVFASDSPEAVVTSTTPQVSKVLTFGRNVNMRQRVTGNALALEIENEAAAWVTATYYAAGVQVVESGTLYTCQTPHTSGTFATDLAAVKWAVGAARSWAVESITGTVDTSGKVRNKRL